MYSESFQIVSFHIFSASSLKRDKITDFNSFADFVYANWWLPVDDYGPLADDRLKQIASSSISSDDWN